MMNKRKSIIATFSLIICLVGIISYSVDAADTGIKSRGQVLYDADGDGAYHGEGDVFLAAADLESLDQRINTLSGEVQNISGNIENSKDNIVNIINTYPGQVVSPDASFTEISTYINELTNFPSDTYFYVDGTEGDSTIERYKKISGQYYPCDENGNVQEGESPVDVTSKDLLDYAAMAPSDLSAGAGGYVNKSLILGDGRDNAAYYDQGILNFSEKTLVTQSAADNPYDYGKTPGPKSTASILRSISMICGRAFMLSLPSSSGSGKTMGSVSFTASMA